MCNEWVGGPALGGTCSTTRLLKSPPIPTLHAAQHQHQGLAPNLVMHPNLHLQSPQITLSPEPLVLAPSATTTLSLSYRPLLVGPASGKLLLESAELGAYEWELALAGVATNPERSIGFSVPLGSRDTQVGRGRGGSGAAARPVRPAWQCSCCRPSVPPGDWAAEAAAVPNPPGPAVASTSAGVPLHALVGRALRVQVLAQGRRSQRV